MFVLFLFVFECVGFFSVFCSSFFSFFLGGEVCFLFVCCFVVVVVVVVGIFSPPCLHRNQYIFLFLRTFPSIGRTMSNVFDS